MNGGQEAVNSTLPMTSVGRSAMQGRAENGWCCIAGEVAGLDPELSSTNDRYREPRVAGFAQIEHLPGVLFTFLRSVGQHIANSCRNWIQIGSILNSVYTHLGTRPSNDSSAATSGHSRRERPLCDGRPICARPRGLLAPTVTSYRCLQVQLWAAT